MNKKTENTFFRKIFNISNVIFLLYVNVSSQTFAQNDCGTRLKESVELYNQGMYQQVLDILLSSTATCNYSKSEMEQAQKLIIDSYFELDELEQGTESTIKFLRKNPNYTINNSSDPVMFIQEIESYKINSKLKISLNAGVNKLMPNITKKNSVWEAADYSAPYITKLNLNILLGIEWDFMKNLSLKIGSQFSMHKYERKITAYSNFLLDYSETYYELKLPIELKYTINLRKKWSPSIIAGVYYSQINNSQLSVAVTDINASTGTPMETAEKGISTKDYRAANNYGYMYGGALNYTINRFIISFESLYFNDLKEFTTNTSNITRHEPTLDYYYIDDDLKIRNIEFSIGIAYTFLYQIRKKY